MIRLVIKQILLMSKWCNLNQFIILYLQLLWFWMMFSHTIPVLYRFAFYVWIPTVYQIHLHSQWANLTIIFECLVKGNLRCYPRTVNWSPLIIIFITVSSYSITKFTVIFHINRLAFGGRSKTTIRVIKENDLDTFIYQYINSDIIF